MKCQQNWKLNYSALPLAESKISTFLQVYYGQTEISHQTYLVSDRSQDMPSKYQEKQSSLIKISGAWYGWLKRLTVSYQRNQTSCQVSDQSVFSTGYSFSHPLSLIRDRLGVYLFRPVLKTFCYFTSLTKTMPLHFSSALLRLWRNMYQVYHISTDPPLPKAQ